MDFLNRLPVSYRLSSRWLPLDPERAAKHLKRFRMKWWQKRRGLMDMVLDAVQSSEQKRPFSNEDAVRMAEDANEAMTEAASLDVRFGYYTPLLVVMGRTRSCWTNRFGKCCGNCATMVSQRGEKR